MAAVRKTVTHTFQLRLVRWVSRVIQADRFSS
jgi:hypothetical protein